MTKSNANHSEVAGKASLATQNFDLLQATFDSLPFACFIKDKDLTFRMVNSEFSSILNLPPEKIIGKKSSDFFDTEDAAHFEAVQKEVLETGISQELKRTMTTPDGQDVSTLLQVDRIETADGEHLVRILVREVTDLKVAKLSAEIEHGEARLRAFAESNSDWFWEMDSALRFSYFSASFQDVTGVPPEKLLGKSRRETGVPGVDADYFEQHVTALDNHEPFRDFTHARMKTEDQEIWLSISGNPVFDNNGVFTGYLGSGKDVTEAVKQKHDLLAAQKRAVAADRAKTEFLANMSHEIRTPMNGVMGMAELLLKTNLDPKQATFTDVIVKSGASLLTIINDILDFSKIDAGQMTLHPAPFCLAESIEDVATLVSSRVAEKAIELIVRVDPDLPEMLVGDAGRIRQIATNIMGNAAKFTEQGHVYVNVTGEVAGSENESAKIRISVEDTGIGIPPEDLGKVFDKFSQVDTSATRKHEGTGLGLSIASSLVGLMDGEMGVESVVDQGTTFWFEVTMPVHGIAKTKSVPVDVTGARVLVVDDNSVNRSILSEQLTSWKFDNAVTSGGAEALTVMRSAVSQGVSIDCVVLDYQMPEMDGGAVATAMRQDPILADIPIIMLTSVDETQDGDAFTSLGIQAHLTKPARSSLLLETLIQVLQDDRAKKTNPLVSFTSGISIDMHSAGKQQVQPPAVVEQQAELEKKLAGDPISTGKVTGRATNSSLDPKTGPGGPSGSKSGKDKTNDPNSFSRADGPLDILVCEDNDINQIVFTQILEDAGYSFRMAKDGKEGLAMYKSFSPSMIIMDVSMPQMNGLEATAAIREAEAESGTHTPIIGVTAHAITGDMDRCFDAGMDDYLSKPISPDKLVEKITQLMAMAQRKSA